ncbi:hypothetical protein ACFIQG_21030 [Comamonas odontotermitis]|uniref:hypothetical protein n=1 Tax=Comamonas odontotermitis TaxID=379895 RepID=UPI00367257A3
MTRVTKPKNVPMAILSIGYQRYVMPSAKAMKVAELMQGAVSVDYDYRATTSTSKYIVQDEELRIAFELVRADQIAMPESAIEPAPDPRQRTAQLTHEPRRLTR